MKREDSIPKRSGIIPPPLEAVKGQKLAKTTDIPSKRPIRPFFCIRKNMVQGNDDIEPVSQNEFLFARYLNPMNYGEKEKGQTLNFEDLSNLAPRNSEMLNLWRDFLQVVKFIDENQEWINPLLRHLKR
ncbi:MAG: hypothetical protein IKS22_09095 [Bacteroidales bacterium]|nr:hypothetical protein [Bacteroidales bacterium]